MGSLLVHISPGAWSPGTEPSALKVWGGEMGRPKQCCQSRCIHSKLFDWGNLEIRPVDPEDPAEQGHPHHA